MATATSDRSERVARRATWPAAVVLAAIVAAVVLTHLHGARPATPFGWVRSAPPPASWQVAATPSGATYAYPPGWRMIESDPGTVSSAPAGERGPLAGYLNATPRSGAETLANWRRFRVGHVAEEGARHVRLLAAAEGLRFRTGHGSCVIDSYSTTRMRFREIACIVTGRRATTVIVAAAPDSQWAERAPLLDRAVASFEP